jgi:hypothetical protein
MLKIKCKKVQFEDVVAEYYHQSEEADLSEPTNNFIIYLAEEVEKQMPDTYENKMVTIELEMNAGLFLYWELLNLYLVELENDGSDYCCKPELVDSGYQIEMGDYIK